MFIFHFHSTILSLSKLASIWKENGQLPEKHVYAYQDGNQF